MTITQHISIDLQQPGNMPMVHAVQGDEYTRRIEIELYSNGVSWNPPDGCEVAIRYGKPDGKGGIYAVLPDNTPAYSIAGNAITVTLAPQMVTVPGVVQVQVSIIKDRKDRLSTFSFAVDVEEDPSKGELKSENYVNWKSYYIPQTTGATVGQFLQISKVDDVGRIIETSPVENPAGEATNKAYEALRIANDVAQEMKDYSPSGTRAIAEAAMRTASSRLVAPKSASVGQYFRVKEVDTNGVVTAVEAVDADYATNQYVQDYAQPKGNYLTEVPEGYAKTTEIPTKPEDIGALPDTYTPPNQTAEQVGADPKGTAASAVSQHNTADDSHGDIRLELKAINDRLTAFFDSDVQTLDELSEIVAYITSNKSLIDSITTSKVSVADIVNNLTSNVINKPLSAGQGVVLKGLVDSVSASLADYQPKGDYALRSELPTVPTKVSQLTNDSGFLAVVTPQKYGAKGNGSADDTVAFQNALVNNRGVFVPGGTYRLSGELVVGNNCQLELAQDAVLYFTQTTGNCISMKMSANIVGNHATVSVPYAFEGHVINIDTDITNTDNVVPPFAQWDPMWKTARFITDLNIVKPDTRGFYYSMDGACSGTAVYLRADYTDVKSFIWAMNLSKLRIAGAFKYGIFAESLKSGLVDSSGWIHQLKMDAFIDACEVGLYLKNIEHTFASVLVLPRRAYTTDGEYIPYAKWGICLENCIDTNLLGSRVMDWNSTYSLWKEGNMYQHIALLGNCRDVKLEDHYYHGYPDYDIRDLIYAENPSNLETVSILEESITRWFKPKNHLPYFDDGNTEKQLLLKDEFNDCFITDYVPNFKDRLPLAIDKDGKIFNEIGYAKSGMRWNQDGTFTTGTEYYGCTGLIKIKAGDTLYLQNMQMGDGSDSVPCVVIFDASLNRVFSNNAKQLAAGESSYYFTYEETETGFTLKVKQPATAAYAAFTFRRELIGNNPAVAVNEPLTYAQQGFLADGIAIKTANVIGLENFVGTEIEQAIANGDFKGDPGQTPVKGTDYFTSDDKAEMVNSVIAALPVYNGEVL